MENASIPAPNVVLNQNNDIDPNRSDKNAFVDLFSPPFISFAEKGTPLSPSPNAHRSMPTTVGQEKAQASRATPDLHMSLKNAFNAVKNIVRKCSDLLSVSPGVHDRTAGGSGIVVKTGRPVTLNMKGDGENPNVDIHHEGLSDAIVIGSRIDDTLVMTKSKVGLDCLSCAAFHIFH